jgi:hypothetical protein
MKYGLSADEYQELHEALDGLCAICDQPATSGNGKKYNRLSIDHNHFSGQVRGLLCHHCNLGLGNFQDDTYRLQRAIDYLIFPPALRLVVGMKVINP